MMTGSSNRSWMRDRAIAQGRFSFNQLSADVATSDRDLDAASSKLHAVGI